MLKIDNIMLAQIDILSALDSTGVSSSWLCEVALAGTATAVGSLVVDAGVVGLDVVSLAVVAGTAVLGCSNSLP